MSSEEELAARLDEEEALAKGPPGWRLEHWSAVRYKTSDSGREWRVDAEPRCIVDAVAKEDAEHIARYDPARALRFVAAVREIIREYDGEGHPEFAYEPSYYAGLGFAVTVLAGIYDES